MLYSHSHNGRIGSKASFRRLDPLTAWPANKPTSEVRSEAASMPIPMHVYVHWAVHVHELSVFGRISVSED